MKKCMIGLGVLFLAVSLCACGTKTGKEPVSVSEIKEVEQTDTEQKEEETKSQGEKQSMEPVENVIETQGTEDTTDQTDVIEGMEPEESTTEMEYPGADVVELVNLRGDETTAYKLVDGTYLDRIERHFTYDGAETWTDEDGVEWNEVVR